MSATPLVVLLFAGKAALYGAVLLAIGASLHIAVGVSDNRRRSAMIVLGGALVGLVLALARLVLTSAQIGAPATAFDAGNLSLAWLTQGASIGALTLGVVLAAITAWLDVRWLHVATAAALAASFALTGHAQGVPGLLLTPIAVFAHVMVAGFWFAAPLSLWPESRSSQTLAVRLERFSAVALFAIPVLFVLGVVLLLRLSGSVHAVFTTAYGLLLLGKLAAAACALGLGGYNKLVLTGEIRRAAPRATLHLKTSLLCEAVLFSAALLLLAAATSFTGPDGG